MTTTARIVRLRTLAEEAKRAYGEETAGGGEPPYPEWADDMLAICDVAASPCPQTDAVGRNEQ